MIAKIPFGRTGHLSSRAIFGAAAFWDVTQEQADRTLATLLAYGVNHIDTAASYGKSEDRLGPWMLRYRKDFFLATKTGERTYQKAKEELHRSLERLRVEQVDLIQLHNLAQADEWDVAMGPGGALEAVVEAREQGLVRFIGVTGHGTGIAAMHLKSLQRFDFDSVLLPYNYPMLQNPQYAADVEALLKLCQARNVAVQTIKGITWRPWGDREHTRAPWYQPFDQPVDIDRAVHWVLGQTGVFLNTAGDVELLPLILDAAARFETRPSDGEMQRAAETLGMEPLFV